MGSRGRSIASAWAFTALVALTSPALAESSKTITGTFPAGAVPAAGRGFADVKAIQLDSGEIVAAQRVVRGGRYSLNLGSGTYQLLYTRLDARAGTFVSKAGAAFTVGKAKAAYQRRGGRRTPGVVAFEVRDFSGATGRLAVMNRGLAELLQTALASADGGCAATPVANSRQRAALDAQRVALRTRGGRAPAFTRDLIVPDVTLRGSLTPRREGALDFVVKVSTKPDGPVFGRHPAVWAGSLQGRGGARARPRTDDLPLAACGAAARETAGGGAATAPAPAGARHRHRSPRAHAGEAGERCDAAATPALSGIAGTAPGDSPKITIRIFSGTTATGLPLQTLTAERRGGGAYAESPAPLAPGTYTARAEQSDSAGNVGLTSPTTFTIDPSYADPVLIGAGDIAGCGSTAGDRTRPRCSPPNPTRSSTRSATTPTRAASRPSSPPATTDLGGAEGAHAARSPGTTTGDGSGRRARQPGLLGLLPRPARAVRPDGDRSSEVVLQLRHRRVARRGAQLGLRRRASRL